MFRLACSTDVLHRLSINVLDGFKIGTGSAFMLAGMSFQSRDVARTLGWGGV